MLKFSFFLLIVCTNLVAQEEDLIKVTKIPFELLEKSNAIIRQDKNIIEINAYNDVVHTNHRIVTVLNEQGNTKLGTVIRYDNNVRIKKIEARIFDINGKEIKKFKEKDFEDVSAVDGGTLYSDSRVKYLKYTPVSYPYTLMFDLEVKYSSTAFVPGWRPIEGFYTSTQNASYKIINNSDVKVKVKTANFDNYNIKNEGDNYYIAKNLNSIQPEEFSPEFRTYAPFLKTSLTVFEMEGLKGINNNWQDFGKWMNDILLFGTEAIPENVRNDIKALTFGIEDPIEKAKIVYQYMQGKTRYVSVQVGIGGWKPMLAEDVNRLGYGDCKGLSNYTKALLNEVGVECYYVVVYGDNDLIDIDDSFSTTEGNHVILTLPREEEYIWLECTNQTNPFGFIAGWTDDRDALIITPEGGKIVHTKVYSKKESIQKTNANIKLSKDASLSAIVKISTQGYQYNLHEGIQNRPMDEQKLYYKSSYWDYLNNIEIDEIKYTNDKDQIIFSEEVKLSLSNYGSNIGDRILFQPNIFNRKTNIPTRYKERTIDFEIQRGFVDEDEFIISLDPSLKIEALPESVLIENKFGTYSFSITNENPKTIVYKRTYSLNKGYYAKEEYNDFRNFISQIVKYDKSKIVLIEEK